jgi:hypothetical protein|tara:strand:- start:2017 stop:2244 length:228 start_codon:yes stop_codon:yes gene_type:complete
MKYQSRELYGGIVITDGLLKELGEIFPDRLPSVLVTEPEISQLVGQQQVVRWLKDKQDEIKEEALMGDNNSVTVT